MSLDSESIARNVHTSPIPARTLLGVAGLVGRDDFPGRVAIALDLITEVNEEMRGVFQPRLDFSDEPRGVVAIHHAVVDGD